MKSLGGYKDDAAIGKLHDAKAVFSLLGCGIEHETYDAKLSEGALFRLDTFYDYIAYQLRTLGAVQAQTKRIPVLVSGENDHFGSGDFDQFLVKQK